MWNQLCGIFMIVKKAEDHVSKRFSPFSQRPAILDLIIQTQVTIRTPSDFVPCDSHLGVCVKSDDVTWEKLEPNTGGYLILAYTSQVIVSFAQSDWFPYLGISCTIHLRAKQDGIPFCFCYGRRTFLDQRSRRAIQYQKSNEIWH